MSDAVRYSRLLHGKGFGCALFEPQLSDDLPSTLRQTGIRIGDVGIVTLNGSFEPIFNILDRAEDNYFGVPQGFEQVRLRHNDIAARNLCHLPGSDISNTAVKKKRLDLDVGLENNVFMPAAAGAIVEVSTNSKETALLLLPDGASRWDLRDLQVFRNYALKHAQSWYEFVNGVLGRMVANGDLYLVTGVTKSTTWSVASLENRSGDGTVSLKLKAAQIATAGASCTWEWESSSSSVNSGPNHLSRAHDRKRHHQTQHAAMLDASELPSTQTVPQPRPSTSTPVPSRLAIRTAVIKALAVKERSLDDLLRLMPNENDAEKRKCRLLELLSQVCFLPYVSNAYFISSSAR
ncbi:hypothetical protein FB451DRAFT_102519 [Mycena latifolia]|nr:hypothetical protein FB451DRAFT_102519 [Mycena latifolia]